MRPMQKPHVANSTTSVVDAEQDESKFMGATNSMAVEARATHETVRKRYG
jgi:hypothetical protein